MLDVVTLGETMILLAPGQLGLLRYARQFQRHVAGAESNLAIGLVRLGHSAGWISRLGADEFGQCVLAAIRGEGVDVSRVRLDPEAPTGVFFKVHRTREQTRVYYYRVGSAASRLCPDDVDVDYVRQARFVHVTGITPALSATSAAAAFRLVAIAREHGVPVSFDPNYRPRLWAADQARPVLQALAAEAAVVIENEAEAALVTGETDPELAALALLQQGPALAVVKLGPAGALAVTAAERVRVPGMVVDVVDTVGAGDAFAAGFLAGQLRGLPLRQSLRIANVMGALTTTVPGDIEAMPTWLEIQPHLQDD